MARDTHSTLEGTSGSRCVEDTRFVVRVTVPYDSPDDSGVLVTFLGGLGDAAETSAETGNNGWPACSTDSRHSKTSVHLLCHNQRRKDPGSLGSQGPMRPPVRLHTQHRQKVPTVQEAKHSEKPNGSSARVWLLLPCIPMSHHRCRTRPGTTRRSTLDDWAISNRFHAMCFIPTYTFAVRTSEFPFFWVIEIGPRWSSGSCGNHRCVHHTLG